MLPHTAQGQVRFQSGAALGMQKCFPTNVFQLRVEGHMAPPTVACIDGTGQRQTSIWRRPREPFATEVMRVISGRPESSLTYV